jgi:hypothetical protein
MTPREKMIEKELELEAAEAEFNARHRILKYYKQNVLVKLQSEAKRLREDWLRSVKPD